MELELDEIERVGELYDRQWDQTATEMEQYLQSDLGNAHNAAHEYVLSHSKRKRGCIRFLKGCNIVFAALVLIVAWTALEDVMNNYIEMCWFLCSTTYERDAVFIFTGVMITIVAIGIRRKYDISRKYIALVRRPGTGSREWGYTTRNKKLKKIVAGAFCEILDEVGSALVWIGTWSFIQTAFTLSIGTVWYPRLIIAVAFFLIYGVTYVLR